MRVEFVEREPVVFSEKIFPRTWARDHFRCELLEVSFHRSSLVLHRIAVAVEV